MIGADMVRMRVCIPYHTLRRRRGNFCKEVVKVPRLEPGYTEKLCSLGNAEPQ
jgi:hypothetical protein